MVDDAKLAAFALEAARYFESRPVNGEDSAHWANAAHADTNAAMNILRAGEQPASRGAVRPSVKREPSAEITQ